MLLDKFKKYVDCKELCSTDDKILLAVSGGVDSMAMLDLFSHLDFKIGVAHCNFQLRGPEAYEDEVFVEEAARRFGIPHYNIRFDTKAEMEITGESVQLAARRLRYQWFDRLCREHGYTKIAIAHHADDSVETFFINMLRGTGLRGLTGINIVNGKLIRPMLFATRKDILEYAKVNGLKYREDSSNSSTKYLRNKIRLGIIPKFKDISPHFTETMTENVERLTDALLFMDRTIEHIRGQVETIEGDRITIDLTGIDPGLPQSLIVFELLRKYGFTGNVTENVCRSIGNCCVGGKRYYSRDKVAYLYPGKIIVTPIPGDDTCETLITEDSRLVDNMGSTLVVQHLDIDDLESLKTPENIALLDMDKLKFPLKVRRWQSGDSFVPFGMDGSKKISDFLIDSKVALPDKCGQSVVLSGDDIVWVVGRRVDDRYRVTSSTENVLRIIKDLESIH